MELQKKVNDAMNQVIVDLDKSHLRNFQYKMHSCAAKCYSDKFSSMEEVHNCVRICSEPLVKTSEIVEGEMTAFQNRLQRCAQDCEDNVKMDSTKDMDELKKNKLQKDYTSCVSKCVDQNLALLPNLVKKIQNLIQD